MPILDKRKGDDILALVPASKRTKHEVIFSSREKAVVQSDEVLLYENQTFTTFAEFLNRLHLYESETNQSFKVRYSKKLKNDKQKLIYSEILYICHKNNFKNKKPNSSIKAEKTSVETCQQASRHSEIKLALSRDKKFLVIKRLNSVNNNLFKVLHLNDMFNSYKVFRQLLQQYEEENKEYFSVKWSKKIKNDNGVIDIDKLIYLEILLISNNTGKSPVIIKGLDDLKCPAEIKLSLSKSKKTLEIRRMTVDHNHEMEMISPPKRKVKREPNGEIKTSIIRSKRLQVSPKTVSPIECDVDTVEPTDESYNNVPSEATFFENLEIQKTPPVPSINNIGGRMTRKNLKMLEDVTTKLKENVLFSPKYFTTKVNVIKALLKQFEKFEQNKLENIRIDELCNQAIKLEKRIGQTDRKTDLDKIFSHFLTPDKSAMVSNKQAVIEMGPPRTSSLMAPVMLLEGHQGDIFSVEFHPEGQYLASTGFDRQIFIWNVYGECENISAMSGHSGAVMEIHFSPDGNNLYTASTDMTLGLWDFIAGTRIKKLKGHTSFVNSVNGARRGPTLLCSGSDDSTIRVWDPRSRNQTHTLNNTYQVTAVTFNDTAEQVISGGIDNDIKVWDLRKNAIIYKLKGHTDTITGLSLSPDGSYVLSNSMDNNLRIWDVRPFAPYERCVKILSGHQHNFEKNLLRCAWSPDGSKVSAGSSDRFHYIWDTTSRRVLYKLPGHNGSVNDVDFHPKEPIICSGSSDKQIYMGEIET